MPRKQTTGPIIGTIFTRPESNKLYIKLGKIRKSTGLEDTPNGRKLAEALLEELYKQQHGISKAGGEIGQMTIGQAYGQFSETLVNRAEKTRKEYALAFRKVLTDPSKLLTVDNIDKQVMIFLQNPKYSNVTKRTYLVETRVFITWLLENDYLSGKVKSLKLMPRAQKFLAQSYTDEELEKVRIFLQSNKQYELALLLRFMVLTGARGIDALTLRWKSVDFRNSAVTWKNKITKIEEVRPINRRALNILKVLRMHNTAKPFHWQYPPSKRLRLWINRAIANLYGQEFNGIRDLEQDNRSLQEFRVTFSMKLMRLGAPDSIRSYLLRHSDSSLAATHYTDIKEVLKYLEHLK